MTLNQGGIMGIYKAPWAASMRAAVRSRVVRSCNTAETIVAPCSPAIISAGDNASGLSGKGGKVLASQPANIGLKKPPHFHIYLFRKNNGIGA
jgi:hypothetical protein